MVVSNVAPLKQPFKDWLEANGFGVSVDSYPRSIEAISIPLSTPMSKTTGSWEGVYEYVIGESPKVDVFSVTGRHCFDSVYARFSQLMSKPVQLSVPGIDQQRHQELIDYTLKSGNSIDKGRLYCAYNKYKEFLTWFDLNKGFLGFTEQKGEVMDNRVLAAIRTKPFILLAGISGTGKSRMVRQLARGLCPDESTLSLDPQDPTKKANKPGNFESIPVKPNWHDSTELLGYVTLITEDKKPKFVLTPFVKFLAKAWMNENVPFFLCLDEMNLAPVEQYFAEYLSVIESRDWVDENDHSKGLQTDVMVHFDVAQSSPGEGTAATTENFVKETVAALLEKELANIDIAVKAKAEALQAAWVKDGGIRIPANLVVMGTVNMDETTCSFSRKVLDRAMTFELNDVSDMYDPANITGEAPYAYGSIGPDAVKQTLLTGKDACVEDAAKSKSILTYIKTINDVLENTSFKIAYRSRNEIMVYCLERTRGGLVELPQALDEATSMKILSRIEGDEQKLVDPSPEGAETSRTLLDVLGEKIPEALNAANGGTPPRSPCEICKGKIEFMKRRLNGGFTNFFV